jgi:hypothetical protein
LGQTAIPKNAKSLLREWLEEIHQTEATKIYGGKTFPSLVRQRALASAKGLRWNSVFFAVPYFMLSKRCRSVTDTRDDADFHPIRALVQSFYRTDSLFSREKYQAIRRVWGDLDENELVFVPQLWGLVVGDRNNFHFTSVQKPLEHHTDST